MTTTQQTDRLWVEMAGVSRALDLAIAEGLRAPTLHEQALAIVKCETGAKWIMACLRELNVLISAPGAAGDSAAVPVAAPLGTGGAPNQGGA